MQTETLAFLKNFAGINKYMRIDEGNTIRIYNTTAALYAEATVEDTFPRTFSIYDLNQWLATMTLFNEPHIDYNDKHISISSGRVSAKYRYSSPSITLDQPKAPPPLPPELFTFKLPKEQLTEILKATAVLGLKELHITPKGLRAITSDDRGEAIDNEYTTAIADVNWTSQVDENIHVKIKIESLKMLILDYNVSVNEKAIVMTSSDNKIKYYIALGIVKK